MSEVNEESLATLALPVTLDLPALDPIKVRSHLTANRRRQEVETKDVGDADQEDEGVGDVEDRSELHERAEEDKDAEEAPAVNQQDFE